MSFQLKQKSMSLNDLGRSIYLVVHKNTSFHYWLFLYKICTSLTKTAVDSKQLMHLNLPRHC